jgi:hypothetical protein
LACRTCRTDALGQQLASPTIFFVQGSQFDNVPLLGPNRSPRGEDASYCTGPEMVDEDADDVTDANSDEKKQQNKSSDLITLLPQRNRESP